MKNLFSILFLSFSALIFCQVGINTDSPEATLDIAANSILGVPSYNNGGLRIGFPGQQKKQLNGRYLLGIADLMNQQILMRDSISGKVDYMYRYALDYHALRPSHIGSLGAPETPFTELDHTILVRGDIHLPTGQKYNGKTIRLIYDSQVEIPYRIYGAMKYNSQLTQNITEDIYISRVNSGYILQSDGIRWYVVGGFEQEDNDRVETATVYDGDIIKVKDRTVLIKGNVSLPTPNTGGYEVSLIYNGDGNQAFTVTGAIDDGGSILNNYNLSANNGNKGVKLQSDGTYWRVLSKR